MSSSDSSVRPKNVCPDCGAKRDPRRSRCSNCRREYEKPEKYKGALTYDTHPELRKRKVRSDRKYFPKCKICKGPRMRNTTYGICRNCFEEVIAELPSIRRGTTRNRQMVTAGLKGSKVVPWDRSVAIRSIIAKRRARAS